MDDLFCLSGSDFTCSHVVCDSTRVIPFWPGAIYSHIYNPDLSLLFIFPLTRPPFLPT